MLISEAGTERCRLGYYITVLAVAQVQEDYKDTPPRTPEDSVIWTIVQHCDQVCLPATRFFIMHPKAQAELYHVFI